MVNLVLEMSIHSSTTPVVDLIGVSYLSRGHRGLPGRWSGMPALRVNKGLREHLKVSSHTGILNASNNQIAGCSIKRDGGDKLTR